LQLHVGYTTIRRLHSAVTRGRGRGSGCGGPDEANPG
jgi:hypothetical protein